MKTRALVLAVILLPLSCLGWDRQGHRIIALVAEDHLDQSTKVMIQSLMGNNHLYSIASWADEIRKQRRDTAPWHFVDIPLGSTYDSERDCAQQQSCVVEKINDFIKVLTDKQASRERRAEALKFLVNLVGDIHQPMHAVREARGGNEIHVRFESSYSPCPGVGCHFSLDTNLHALWDTFPTLRMGPRQHIYSNDETVYARAVEELIRVNHLYLQDGGKPVEWANESARLAQKAWVKDGAELDERYYDEQIRVVDRQMALAGLRLAALLNATIGKMTVRDFR